MLIEFRGPRGCRPVAATADAVRRCEAFPDFSVPVILPFSPLVWRDLRALETSPSAARALVPIWTEDFPTTLVPALADAEFSSP